MNLAPSGAGVVLACIVCGVHAMDPAIGSANASRVRGAAVYARYCVTCHGESAQGDGQAARLFTPRPANLRLSDKGDAYLVQIITLGGAAMARSAAMPAWQSELTPEQVADLVVYLRAINERQQTKRSPP